MVVIIDDRADVWEWSPNLVKVIPCGCTPYPHSALLTDFRVDDFFVGIGDINSAFLPKLEPMTPVLPQEAPKPLKPEGEATTPTSDDSSDTIATQLTDTTLSLPSSSLSLDEELSLEEVEQSEIAKIEIITRNHMALDQQVEERPLARKQEELQVESSAEAGPSSNDSAPDVKEDDSPSAAPKHAARKALLKNDDIEFVRVQNVRSDVFETLASTLTVYELQLLDEIHRRFFVAYDVKPSDPPHLKRKPGKRPPKGPAEYDVRVSFRTLFKAVHELTLTNTDHHTPTTTADL